MKTEFMLASNEPMYDSIIACLCVFWATKAI